MKDCQPPNLFIIGAPKCGTTTVFRWLAAHPHICTSKSKETWFYADHELSYLNIRPNYRDNSSSDYLSCFEPVSEDTQIKMEGSTHYLYSRPALAHLSKMAPKPKIIVQLRKPANRIWSHFNYIKQQAVAPIKIKFPDYVSALLNRNGKVAGKFTSEAWPQYLLENQLRYSNYQQHLLGWLKFFGRDHLKILILEDIANQKQMVVENLAEWINVSPGFYDGFEFRSANRTRSRTAKIIRKRLRNLSRHLPASIAEISKPIASRSLNFTQPKVSKSDRNAIDDLNEYFVVPNERLQNDFDLNLSSWSR